MTTLFRSGPAEKCTKAVLSLRPTGFSGQTVKPAVVSWKDKAEYPMTSRSMEIGPAHTRSLFSPGIRAVKNVFGHSQARLAHTDVVFPNFDDYRRDSTKDPTQPARQSEDQRRLFTYMTYGVGGMLGLYIGKTTVLKLVEYKSPARTQLALANVEINIADIAEGASQTFLWRGKPVFVRHRKAHEVERERNVDLSTLRDPEHDNDRVKNPEWMVVIGICTHLGCVPIANAGDFGGYYCPCHGSHYDASGRIRKGPAPLNLEVPEYSFVNDTTILVGGA